VWLIKLWR